MLSKWLSAKKPFKALEIAPEQIHFLGEPDGGGTAVLKADLSKILVAEGNVAKAYLSRVRYGSDVQIRLALVVDSRAPAVQTAEVIARACQQLVMIDILFMESLSPSALENLTESISPFFPIHGPENLLFLINMQIGRGENSEMPANLIGAYVAVFVAATNTEAAALAAVKQLRSQGYEFLDVSDKKIHQLDPEGWNEYVKSAWPEFETHFPSQDDVILGLPFGRVFFGPFVGYESQNA